ncbi:MAG: hypothetical protein DHS20C19_05520 [Acidimicrobiales bacterium]|nr:MAG: hypothetical protein DHS20C19_05520 [Acidimicrobiales bacterium]
MLATVALSLLVLVVTSAIAWDGSVPAWEVSALEFVNGWPDWFEPAMWVLQQVGVLFAPVVAGLFIARATGRWVHAVPFALVLPLKLGIEKGLVKQLVERERPFTSIGPEIDVRGSAFDGLSFPSGHTTTAFALAILVSAFLPPRWRPVPIVWAFVVGIARLYYGEHNLLDVVAGAALGTAFAVFLWWAFLNRHVHPDCRCAS